MHAVEESLRQIFDAAIESAAPAPAVLKYLPDKPIGRCVVIGAGKAAAAMASAIDSAWPDVDVSGIVSTRYGHSVPAGRIRVFEAGHPVPDQASEDAARLILESLETVTAEDLVIAVMSGGGSATLALPIEPLSLDDKQQITRQLLESGAPIDDINTVRAHLSQVKGGKLAKAAAPAKLVTLLISDVPGDDPAIIASGPTIPCDSGPADAVEILDRYEIEIPSAGRAYLETVLTDREDSYIGTHAVVASPAMALRAAAETARSLGFNVVVLGDCIEGESADVGRAIAGIARSVNTMQAPSVAPAALISGGETTVTIGPEGAGRGGRNTEFLLAFALALQGAPGIWALAGDSDGIDGTEDAAGAIVTPDTLERAASAGIDPHESLRRHDSYSLFAATGDLVKTGPTLTNVNDIRIVLIT